MIVNAVDIHAHGDKRIVTAAGENRDIILIDFVRGESSFDRLSSELGCRKLGSGEWMLSTALCVAREWLGARIECGDYERTAENLFGR